MRWLLLITTLGIATCAGNTSYAQRRSATDDWISVQACQIAFQVPRNLKRNRREGIDSCIVEFENRDMLLSIDYGWYGGAEKQSDLTHDFKERSLPIDGKRGTLATYIDNSLYARNHPRRKYVAHIFVVVESIEQEGLPNGITLPPTVTSVMMTVRGHNAKVMHSAERIFRSVRFKSTARRTSACTGLAGEWPLTGVVWASR